MIRLEEKQRSNLKEIKNLPVRITPDATVPLWQVANIRFEETCDAIMREQTRWRMAVLVNPRGRDTESFVKEAQDAVKKQVKIPSGYYLEWGGKFENLLQARRRLMVLTPPPSP